MSWRLPARPARKPFTNYFPQINASGGAFQAQHGLVQADFGVAIPQLGIDESAHIDGQARPVRQRNGRAAALRRTEDRHGKPSGPAGRRGQPAAAAKSEGEIREQTDTYYWQIVSLKENLSTLDAVERQLNEIHRQVELSVKAGLVTANDLLRVELRQQEVASNRLKVENGLKVSKLLLAQHIGADWKGFDIAQLSFDDPETPDRYYIPVEEALDHRAEYQLAEKNVEAQLYQKRMERGKLLPTVGVGAGYLYYNVTDKDVDDGMVFAQVSVPISAWWGGAHALKRPASVKSRPRTTGCRPVRCWPSRSRSRGATCRRPTPRFSWPAVR